ncbi:fibroblast growth factor 5 isoform 2-T2 [Liasis olivaceus]
MSGCNQHACSLQLKKGIDEMLQTHTCLGLLEIFAVSQGIVGIRGVFSNKFLAMSKKGKLHASAKFTDDCKFRERFQENSYNTYSSAVHRTVKTGREWYVALNKRGKAKRGCSPRVKPQHVSTHFLPRFKQAEPPELSFTVAVPEKKRPPVVLPAKPKVPLVVPRKKPVKYRLKFRFG